MYKITEENIAFINESLASSDFKEKLTDLSNKIEHKENELLTEVSKNYLKIIEHCQELNNLSLPEEIHKNLPKLKEIGNKILYSTYAQKENAYCLERVQFLIKEIKELLKIVKYLGKEGSLKEEVYSLEMIKIILFKFYKYNFYTNLETMFKQKLIYLNNRTKEEAADWIVFLKRSTPSIIKQTKFTKNESLIFNDFYSTRGMYDMNRINDVVLASKKLGINLSFLYDYLHSFENEDELIVFAIALYFLSEISEVVYYLDCDKIDSIEYLKKLKELYFFLNEDITTVENKHKKLSLDYLEKNRNLLESDFNEFLSKVDIDYKNDLAEFIDTFICNKFVEGKKVDVSKLVKDKRFTDYQWNWKILLEKEKNKNENEALNELKKKVNELVKSSTKFINKLIDLLNQNNNETVNLLESFLYDKLKNALNDTKNTNELKGEIVILVKYLQERKCSYEKIKELLK
ncbi:hypothetical protein H312_02568, partial [Anncaliia algerae PRA339]